MRVLSDRPGLQTLAASVCLVIAAVLQSQVAHRIAVRHAQPDFLLVVLACVGTLLGGVRGTLLGFWAGLLTALLAPVPVALLLTSRTVSGAFAGVFQRVMIRDSVLVPPFVVLMTTLIAEIGFALMSPTHHLRRWAGLLGGELLCNLLLSLPVYFGLRALGIGQQSRGIFSDPL